jgi:protein-disulfide isomerase
MSDTQRLSIPQAILIAGVLIAGAILVSSLRSSTVAQAPGNESGAEVANEPADSANSLGLVLPTDPAIDHIRGNPDAQITIYEYSDIDCPFCKRFHDTLRTVVDEYEEVRWVYRHLPLEGLHPEAFEKAVITECVFAQAGPEVFWAVLDQMYDAPGPLARLPDYVEQYGLDARVYATCLESEAARARVERDMANAFATRGSTQIGTPWSIIELPDGSHIPFSGAQPLSVLRGVIDSILAQN